MKKGAKQDSNHQHEAADAHHTVLPSIPIVGLMVESLLVYNGFHLLFLTGV